MTVKRRSNRTTEVCSVTIQPDLLAEIDKAAQADDLTRSQWFRVAARQALARARSEDDPLLPFRRNGRTPSKRKLARR